MKHEKIMSGNFRALTDCEIEAVAGGETDITITAKHREEGGGVTVSLFSSNISSGAGNYSTGGSSSPLIYDFTGVADDARVSQDGELVNEADIEIAASPEQVEAAKAWAYYFGFGWSMGIGMSFEFTSETAAASFLTGVGGFVEGGVASDADVASDAATGGDDVFMVGTPGWAIDGDLAGQNQYFGFKYGAGVLVGDNLHDDR